MIGLQPAARAAARAVAAGAVAAGLLGAVGCHESSHGPYLTAEQAVQAHIAAAKAGDIAKLRRLACGRLAAALASHSDAEIHRAFDHAYDAGAQHLHNHPDSATRATVHGHFDGDPGVEFAFATEESGGWRVCAIERHDAAGALLPGLLDPPAPPR